MHITSLQNPRIKSILRLRMKSRERQRGGLFLVEGADEIELAVAAGHPPKTVVYAPDLTRHEIARTDGEWLTVTPAIFRKLSLRERPDGWMAVFPIPGFSLKDLKFSGDPLLRRTRVASGCFCE